MAWTNLGKWTIRTWVSLRVWLSNLQAGDLGDKNRPLTITDMSSAKADGAKHQLACYCNSTTVKQFPIFFLQPNPNPIFVAMSLPIRITFEGVDYSYTILTRKIHSGTSRIKIGLGGRELVISRDTSGGWDAPEHAAADDYALLRAIARNVVLRYGLQ